jgi:hypothetical protein
MTFSERMGLVQPKTLVQAEDMDNDLRTVLWNALYGTLAVGLSEGDRARLNRTVFQRAWVELWGQALDKKPSFHAFVAVLREMFFTQQWHQVYDFIEFTATNFSDAGFVRKFVVETNAALERGRSAYRIVGNRLQRITGAQEIAAVEQAIRDATAMPLALRHLDRAAELLADRLSPDYRNSIKESISAVEAVCEDIAGKKSTLGACLKNLPGSSPLHPALSSAFQKLYGYTSDAQGIRHALSEEPALDHADAMDMLVACSAFVSYMVAKSSLPAH